jgi:hydrogenase maturation protein HypF
VVPLPAGTGASHGDLGDVATILASDRIAVRLDIRGVVQGVGFRPFIHRLACRHGLSGWVRNASGEVQCEIEGARPAIDAFLGELRENPPPLARVDQVNTRPVVPTGTDRFTIVQSADQPDGRQPVPPDAAICSACEAELFDPRDRRYRYPFITCTNCGPRFTVIEALPYDRERTSMRVFAQCPACHREYQSPRDRRFHSETNSCSACGPRLWFQPDGAGSPIRDSAALDLAAALIREGRILALRGLGGFHLAVDATSEAAVARLRARKHRDSKPLAVMVRDLPAARELGVTGALEEALLRSAERPVVLLRRRMEAPVAPAVAPGLDTLGVLLPTTPLHCLLLEEVGRPLVMTSGNLSEEPIATGNAEARERLAGVADGFLLHDREIVARYDDSVLRVAGTTPILLRRARGYTPLPLELPVSSPQPLLAVGPHLKNTFTLVHGAGAYVSQHIGDLESLETLEHFEQALARFRRLFRIDPAVVARDLHPGYLSSRIAEGLGLERTISVQHHHAHIAAVLAEHGLTGPALGIAYDGTGYGPDGNVWGGELLRCDLEGYQRIAHLRYVPLPGGDAAARAPWRAALGYLAMEPAAAGTFRLAGNGVSPLERSVVERQLVSRINTPLASSMGRLFDAAAALLGVRQVSQYEGQAAMELESLAGNRPGRELPWAAHQGEDGGWILDPMPLLTELGRRRCRGEEVADLAAALHESIAAATAELALRAAETTGLATVALGGGVFQNARLVVSLEQRLVNGGLSVLLPRRLGPNDGAVSYGQAAVAAAQLAAEKAGAQSG